MTSDEFHAARKRLGMTQAELAARIGYGKRQVEAYERGEVEIPIIVDLGVTTLLYLAKNNSQ